MSTFLEFGPLATLSYQLLAEYTMHLAEFFEAGFEKLFIWSAPARKPRELEPEMSTIRYTIECNRMARLAVYARTHRASYAIFHASTNTNSFWLRIDGLVCEFSRENFTKLLKQYEILRAIGVIVMNRLAR